MSFSYHRAEREIEDFIIFNIHEGAHSYRIQVSDEVVREAMKNTDRFCCVLDAILQQFAYVIKKEVT